jgi:hypothetical protein
MSVFVSFISIFLKYITVFFFVRFFSSFFATKQPMNNAHKKYTNYFEYYIRKENIIHFKGRECCRVLTTSNHLSLNKTDFNQVLFSYQIFQSSFSLSFLECLTKDYFLACIQLLKKCHHPNYLLLISISLLTKTIVSNKNIVDTQNINPADEQSYFKSNFLHTIIIIIRMNTE